MKTGKFLNARIGKNIKWALKGSAISQSKAAALLGITRQTLCNYLTGITPIDIEKLLKIADITGKDPGYFYSDIAPPAPDANPSYSLLKEDLLFQQAAELFESYVFRSDIAISGALKEKFEKKIKQYAEIEKINEITPYQFKIDSALERFDRTQIELIAQKVRGLFEIGPATPISNPVYELERNNVKIIQFPEENQGISGFSAHNDELGYCIYLNSKCTIERRFFTAAHELAHLIFHKKDYTSHNAKNKLSDCSFVSSNNSSVNKGSFTNPKSGLFTVPASMPATVRNNKVKEDVADEFAGLFLVPSGSLASFCKNNFMENFVFENVIILKKYFNVSAKCMIKRLLKEGYIAKPRYAELNEETDKRIDPYHEYEPIEKNRIVENHRFRNLVHRALANKKITESEAAAYLKNP